MADLVGCSPCRQSGKLLALGNFKEKCHHCKGIGWVEKMTEKEEEELLNSSSQDEDLPTFSPPPKVEKALKNKPKPVLKTVRKRIEL